MAALKTLEILEQIFTRYSVNVTLNCEQKKKVAPQTQNRMSTNLFFLVVFFPGLFFDV